MRLLSFATVVILSSGCSLIRNLDDFGEGGAASTRGDTSSVTGGPAPVPPFSYLRALAPGDATLLGYGPLDDTFQRPVPRVDPTPRVAPAGDGSIWIAYVQRGVVDVDPGDAIAPVGAEGGASLVLVRLDAAGKVLVQAAHAIDPAVPESIVVTDAVVPVAPLSQTGDVVVTGIFVGASSVMLGLPNGAMQRAASSETDPQGLDGFAFHFDAEGRLAGAVRFGGIAHPALAYTVAADPDDGFWIGGTSLEGLRVESFDGTAHPCTSGSTGTFVARIDSTSTCRSVTDLNQGYSGTPPVLQGPLAIDVSSEHVVVGGFNAAVTQFTTDPAAPMVTLDKQDERAAGYVVRFARGADPTQRMRADWGVSLKDGDAGARHRVEGVALSRAGGLEPGSVFVAGTFEQMNAPGDLAPIELRRAGGAVMPCVLAATPSPDRDHDAFLAWIGADGDCKTSLVIGGVGDDFAGRIARLVEGEGASKIAVPFLFAAPPPGFSSTFATPGGTQAGVGAFVFDAQGISMLGSSLLVGNAGHATGLARTAEGALVFAGSYAGPGPGREAGAAVEVLVGALLPEYTPR